MTRPQQVQAVASVRLNRVKQTEELWVKRGARQGQRQVGGELAAGVGASATFYFFRPVNPNL